MRKGLLPVILGMLIVMWLSAVIFETQINTAPPLLQGVLLGIAVLVAFGLVLLAMWDTRIIGKI